MKFYNRPGVFRILGTDSFCEKYLLKLLDNDKATALEVLTKAAEYRGTKNFDDSVYGWIVQEVAKKAEREKKGLSGWDKTTEAMRNGAKAIMDFASMLTPVGISNRMIGMFTEIIKLGTDPQVAAQEVIRKEVLNLQPEAINYPDGMKVIDANGKRKIIKPNGDIVDDVSSKKETGKKE